MSIDDIKFLNKIHLIKNYLYKCLYLNKKLLQVGHVMHELDSTNSIMPKKEYADRFTYTTI